MSRWMRTLLSLSAAASLAACGGDSKPTPTPTPTPELDPLPLTLFAASEGALAAINLETGEQRNGTVADISGPTDLQVLEDATLMMNLTSRNEVLAVDGRTLQERARFASSSLGGTRPTHSYVSPARNGKRYWLTLNDGVGNRLNSSTALFVDATEGSSTYLQPVGEVRLGVGHHKASFSNTRERIVISNIADCDEVLSVYDYSDVQNIQKVQTFSAGSLGLTCSLSAPLLPHGCATSKVSGRAYCSLTGSGSIISVDLDAAVPSAKVISTGGRGGGFMEANWDGRYLYSVQASPREDSTTPPGAACQVGQLAVVDASTDSVAREVPLRYRGPDCTATLAGTDEAKAEVSHLVMGPNGTTLYVTLGAFNDADAHVRQELVVDLSQPGAPAQRASIALGPSNGSPADSISPDGRFLFVANTTDNNLSQIDTATNTVVHVFNFFTSPKTMGLFSTASGPSEHVGPIH